MATRKSSLLLATLALAVAACRTASPPAIERVPDPLRPPPSGAELAPEQQSQARSAVAAAESGDFAKAAKLAGTLPRKHSVTMLVALEIRFLHGEVLGEEALKFARASDGYPTAWGFAGMALERDGEVEQALGAFREAATRQPDAMWAADAQRVERRAINAAAQEANGLLAQGKASEALARARRTLEAIPGATQVRVSAIRAALALSDTRTATELLPALPDTPEGLEIKGKVAEELGQWDLALDFYRRLPSSYPGQCELLFAAREQVRLANAPPYLAKIFTAPKLARRALAALLVWETGALEGKANGPVQVFEDIVQLPEQREIVTAVRAGVMTGDAVARRFNPNRTVSGSELASTLERLAHVLGRPAPRWCDERQTPGCVTILATVDGHSAVGLIREVSGGEGAPCQKR